MSLGRSVTGPLADTDRSWLIRIAAVDASAGANEYGNVTPLRDW